MEELLEKLRRETLQFSGSGDPKSYFEQARFVRSGVPAAFYWSENSFLFLFKPSMGEYFTQVVYCNIRKENNRIKIHTRATLNRSSFYIALYSGILAVIFLILGILAREPMLFKLAAFIPVMMIIGWFVHVKSRMEAKEFLMKLVARIQRETNEPLPQKPLFPEDMLSQ